jgi:hypothetical protein
MSYSGEEEKKRPQTKEQEEEEEAKRCESLIRTLEEGKIDEERLE